MTHPAIAFKPSNPESIGMEIEYQLVDANTLDLRESILDLMKLYPDSEFVKPEFVQNTVEIISPVCYSVRELEESMRALVSDVHGKCASLGMAICGAGTHPFSKHLAAITPLSRYLQMAEEEGYTSHTQITFATHIHIGMTSGEEAIRVMRKCKRYLPLLIALSANSPFWRGEDTSYAAFRHYVLASTRSYGLPPSFNSWQEFESFMAVTRERKIFNTINDIHWDIRPRPHLGTLEIRVMDSQITVSDAMSLAAFVQALVHWLREDAAEPASKLESEALHWWIEKDNHYQAAHFGLQASIYDEYEDRELTLAEQYASMSQALAGTIGKLQLQGYCAHLDRLVARNGNANFQRQIFAESLSFGRVVSRLIVELDNDINSCCPTAANHRVVP